MPSRDRSRIAAALARAAALLVLASCSSPGGSTASAPSAGSRFADGVAVLGDSISTAKNSDPAHPEQDAEQNSWATGTAPAVQSVYLRLVAVNPAARGHALDLAVDDAGIDGVLAQARQLVQHPRAHELVLLQGISADLRCDGSDPANEGPFAKKVGQVLDVLAAGLPDPDIVLVSLYGTSASHAQAFSQVDPTAITGDGPCDAIDPATGKLSASRISYAGALVQAYESRTAAVCTAHPHCRTDGRAARGMALAPADFVPYDIHFSVRGEHDLAAVLWPAIYPGAH
ncbi:hypothetical protein [Leifsonia shinshuensis]|uniref:SGNH/GDSL hydrolase family protein n=1 Tax=Leifsonia shinshuensis TaxID=150026 RepID=A0A853CPH6_9MICO|nr:hypothetical protein [Leifsonia shinshuensis]NYJ22776.1 hypothetical protein [Leifsonia shinshuensis]